MRALLLFSALWLALHHVDALNLVRTKMCRKDFNKQIQSDKHKFIDWQYKDKSKRLQEIKSLVQRYESRFVRQMKNAPTKRLGRVFYNKNEKVYVVFKVPKSIDNLCPTLAKVIVPYFDKKDRLAAQTQLACFLDYYTVERKRKSPKKRYFTFCFVKGVEKKEKEQTPPTPQTPPNEEKKEENEEKKEENEEKKEENSESGSSEVSQTEIVVPNQLHIKTPQPRTISLGERDALSNILTNANKGGFFACPNLNAKLKLRNLNFKVDSSVVYCAQSALGGGTNCGPYTFKRRLTYPAVIAGGMAAPLNKYQIFMSKQDLLPASVICDMLEKEANLEIQNFVQNNDNAGFFNDYSCAIVNDPTQPTLYGVACKFFSNSFETVHDLDCASQFEKEIKHQFLTDRSIMETLHTEAPALPAQIPTVLAETIKINVPAASDIKDDQLCEALVAADCGGTVCIRFLQNILQNLKFACVKQKKQNTSFDITCRIATITPIAGAPGVKTPDCAKDIQLELQAEIDKSSPDNVISNPNTATQSKKILVTTTNDATFVAAFDAEMATYIGNFLTGPNFDKMAALIPQEIALTDEQICKQASKYIVDHFSKKTDLLAKSKIDLACHATFLQNLATPNNPVNGYNDLYTFSAKPAGTVTYSHMLMVFCDEKV